MRVAIVEDEAIVARRLERVVRAALGERLRDLVTLATLADAREHLRTVPLDLVFLDLNLNGRDGFELLAEAAASGFQTVIVSAYDDQAIRAFEFGVTDFVAKPWTDERVGRAIARVLGREPLEAGRAARLAVRHAGAIELIEIDRVVAVRGADDYAELCLEGGVTRLHEKTLNDLERMLPAGFARVHRSWIVNLERVRGWEPEPGGRATLGLGDVRVPVGRTYRAAVVARLEASARG